MIIKLTKTDMSAFVNNIKVTMLNETNRNRKHVSSITTKQFRHGGEVSKIERQAMSSLSVIFPLRSSKTVLDRFKIFWKEYVV